MQRTFNTRTVHIIEYLNYLTICLNTRKRFFLIEFLVVCMQNQNPDNAARSLDLIIKFLIQCENESIISKILINILTL